jgi:hypothetical protein
LNDTFDFEPNRETLDGLVVKNLMISLFPYFPYDKSWNEMTYAVEYGITKGLSSPGVDSINDGGSFEV